MRPRPATWVVFLLLLAPTVAAAGEAEDEAAARAVFEKNLQAIADRDAESYLSCYWPSEKLVRNGFEGVSLGYEGLAEGIGADTWPESFEATDLRVFSLQPGVVYGQYRYRVRFGDEEQEGISERLFLRTDAGWRIAVTTAFGAPAGALPPREENP